jgi:DNA-binding transcriptional ArsR family regulator
VSEDRLQPQRCAELLGALAAPERLRIVQILREGPRNVTELSELLQQPPVNVSHHLTVLRYAGLVRKEKQGRFVVYSLAPGVLQKGRQADSARIDLGCCQLDLPCQPPD